MGHPASRAAANRTSAYLMADGCRFVRCPAAPAPTAFEADRARISALRAEMDEVLAHGLSAGGATAL
jgi:hypothetical protein